MTDERWDIPSNWEWSQAVYFSEIVGGGTPKNSKSEDNYSKKGIPWLTPADLSKYKSSTISRGKRDLSELGFSNSSAKLVPKGTVLFSSRAPIGYCVIAENEISTNQGFKSFVSEGGINSRYLRHYLIGSKEYAESKASGTTFLELSGKKAGELSFPIAPLNEQKRIADKIDALFTRSGNAKEALDTIPALLDQYRQSILAAALSGDLTKDWRENNPDVEPSEKLLERIRIDRRQKWEETELKKMKAKGKEPKNEKWKEKYKKIQAHTSPDTKAYNANVIWMRLEDVCEKITDGTHHSPKSFSEGDRMYVTSKNVREWKIDLSKITYVDEKTHKEIWSRCDVRKNDVLYVKDGANTGLAALNTIEEEFSLLSSVGVLRTSKHLNPEFLVNFLNSTIARNMMLSQMSGNAIPRLTLTKIKNALVPIFPLVEQLKINEIVKVQIQQSYSLKNVMNEQIANLTTLNQSILAKAFRGELVPQDPNDEPASKLLKRIKVKREEHAKQVKKKPRKKAVSKKTQKIKPPFLEGKSVIYNATISKGKLSHSGNKGNEMTITRNDVLKTYLSDLMKQHESLSDAKELYQASEMEIAEFYKQLRDEMNSGLITENAEKGHLELTNAA